MQQQSGDRSFAATGVAAVANANTAAVKQLAGCEGCQGCEEKN